MAFRERFLLFDIIERSPAVLYVYIGNSLVHNHFTGLGNLPPRIFTSLATPFSSRMKYILVFSESIPATLLLSCYDSYIWVGFESEEDIPEYYKGEKLLTAFQINTQVSCKNLKTGESNIVSNHFVLQSYYFFLNHANLLRKYCIYEKKIVPLQLFFILLQKYPISL